MTPRLMNAELASHLILAGNTLKKKPDTCSPRNITNGFIPEILAGQCRALIGQFEPSLASDWSRERWMVEEILNRSPVIIYTNLGHSSPLSAPQTQSVIIHFNNPASSKMQGSIVSFYESFFNENDRASNTRNSVWTQRLQNALHPSSYNLYTLLL